MILCLLIKRINKELRKSESCRLEANVYGIRITESRIREMFPTKNIQ